MSETAQTTTQNTECPEKADIDTVATATTLLATGKRHLLCGEIHNAIESLQESCRLLAEKFGEAADECGEVYFFYGKALLELSRMESGVLGNALDGIPEDDKEESPEEDTEKEAKPAKDPKEDQVEDPAKVPEEKHEEISDAVIDALCEAGEPKKKEEGSDEADKEAGKEDTEKMEVETKDTDKEKEEKKEETTEVKKDEETKPDETKADETKPDETKPDETKPDETKPDETKPDETKPDEEDKEKMETAETDTTKKDGETKDDDTAEDEDDDEGDDDDENKENEEKAEDDISNIQLAWEMLDLARVIFARCSTKEMQLKAAQAYLKLGEVGLELENYEQAINDFKDCLKIQLEHLEASDRLLAETHYQLGVANSYNKQYKEAREEFTQAMKVIEDKKVALQKIIDDNKGKEKKEGEEDPATAAQQELDDLGEILPDIQAKIKDTVEEEEQLKQIAKDVMGGFGTAAGFDQPSTSTEAKPIATKKTEEKVNVLVPRKRKAEEEVPEADKETKKTKQEDGSGDAVVNKTEATNGTNGKEVTNGTNGTHKENGDTKMDTSDAEAKIVTKTVEDVKKQTEGEATA
ncbi:histone-binding protein N1/N2-like isoform X1 [Lineus longissimus]|uniref:histone-binding protein N1/N2-like isoform X1 n=1 Tax=Lineus longissimus TaxID=88925 RepID=UPI002B4F7B1B